MPIQLRVIAIVLAVVFLVYTFYLVQKDRAEIRHMSKWLIGAVVILFFAIFPGVGLLLAHLLGIQSFFLFALLVVAGLLVIIALRFQLSLIIAEKKVTKLVQQVSILQKEVEELSEEKGVSDSRKTEEIGK